MVMFVKTIINHPQTTSSLEPNSAVWTCNINNNDYYLQNIQIFWLKRKEDPDTWCPQHGMLQCLPNNITIHYNNLSESKQFS